MPSERVVEIPWALMNLPQSGVILDIGSCEAAYHKFILIDHELHCLDPRDCSNELPAGVVFHHQSIIGNTLPAHSYDAVLLLSTVEHIGLPHYGMATFHQGDHLTIAEIARLLKPGCPLVMTVPAGVSKIASWYRQYSPADLKDLFCGWETTFFHWGYRDGKFVPIDDEEVEQFDYRGFGYGAGAVTGVIARYML